MLLFADLETRSKVSLKKCGVHRYAEDAQILLFCYAFDNDAPRCWDAYHEPHSPPADLTDGLCDPNVTVLFHNAAFDRVILQYQTMLDALFGVSVPIERVYCTMTQAYAHGLPGALDTLGKVLGLPVDLQKIKEGSKLVTLFCEKQADPAKYPEQWQDFIDYGLHDIEAMRAAHYKMPQVNYSLTDTPCIGRTEYKLWQLDQKINDRGICVDLDLARKAQKAGEKAKEKINQRIVELTEGRVTKATQTARIRNELPAMELLDKEAVKQRLKVATDPRERELLQLRQQGNRSSTSKFERLAHAVNADGRLRGVLIYNGAIRTGRWSSRLLQAHNMPRPKMDAALVNAGIEAIKAETVELLFDDVQSLCVDAIRGIIVASPGKRLIAGDWSNIEGRGLAWLAGAEWKLQAFRELDAGTGPDLYKLMYVKALGGEIDAVDSKKRQMGKGMELSLGYGGGVGAFKNVSVSYNMDLIELGEQVPRLVPEKVLKRAEDVYDWAKKQDRLLELNKKQYVACEALKQVWRTANPEIVNYWWALEQAAVKAITYPGREYRVTKCVFQVKGRNLLITLPSGRKLVYPNIRLTENGLSFMKAPAWQRAKLYGGFIAENITQAMCSDILRHSQPKAEAAGYEIVLHVHDELITEVDEQSDLDEKGLCNVMLDTPKWAKGLPLAADGFSAYRYRKDD